MNKIVKVINVNTSQEGVKLLHYLDNNYKSLYEIDTYLKILFDKNSGYNFQGYIWDDDTWTAGYKIIYGIPDDLIKKFEDNFSKNLIITNFRKMKLKRILDENN